MIWTKKEWLKKLKPYHNRSNSYASWQIINTLGPYFFIWALYHYMVASSLSLTILLNIVLGILMISFLIRCFTLMHDCGHHSLFASNKLNQNIGFILGVICGIPQYVWSKHHAYHHLTNGDWERFKGVLNVQTKDAFEQWSNPEKKKYLLMRHPLLVLGLGGFIYLLFNPRYTWLKGNIALLKNYFLQKKQNPSLSFREILVNHSSRYWKTPKEYFHMAGNNIFIVLYWILMSKWIGALAFMAIYIPTVSLAGGVGILIFTIQHNFENSYASQTHDWDYVKGAIEGTSFLKLGRLFNWFSADIAYHHIHHLSSGIPNYHLVKAHQCFAKAFTTVKQLGWFDILHSFYYKLWDVDKKVLATNKK